MAGRIPSEFIDQLLNQADIVDVVNARIPLKKAGREFQACCPFHHEKTPSFTVSPTKQFYHCFGCGAHGTAISFLMEYDNLAFPDAVEELARQLGLEVPREDNQPQGPDYRPLYELLDECRQFYAQQLRQHPTARQAIDYLKQRGLSGEVAARYQLGYAPPGWDNLLKALGNSSQRVNQLVQTGMVTQQDNRQYDRFRERVMFPIHDRRGRVIGFGGRVFGDAKPKYLNSPETPVFHKGRELYGLYEARQANREIARLLVVEGYMDVVALAQFGIDYAVATLGTATTDTHLELVFRTSQQVVFCFDGDRAGRDAAWKALNTCLPHLREGKQAGFLFLPEGEDPDTLIRSEGREAFEQRVDNAQPLSEYLFEKIAEQVDLRSLDGRVRYAELLKPYLEKLPDGLLRQALQQRIDQSIGIEKSQKTNKKPSKVAKSGKKTGLHTIPPVRRAIALLLSFPLLCRDIELPAMLIGQSQPGLPLLIALHDYIREQSNPTLATILEHWRDQEDGRFLDRIALLDLDVLEDDAASQFSGVLSQLQQQIADAEWHALLNHRSPSDLTDEERRRLQELQLARTPQTK